MTKPNMTLSTIPPGRRAWTSAILAALLAFASVSAINAQTVTASPDPVAQNRAIQGKLMQPAGGRPLEGIVVRVEETGATTSVDSRGDFSFTAVAPGTYTLTANGSGYAILKIVDVVVTANR